MSSPTAAERIVSFLESARRGVPPEVARAAKRLLLNGLRAALVSRTAPLSAPVMATQTRALPAPGAGVHPVWSDALASVEDAAFCNAFNWGLVLLDDMEIVSGIHPSGPPAAVALAIAESRSSPGAALLASIAAGIEVQVAVASAAAPELLNDRGFAPITVVAPLGAVAAAVVLHDPPGVIARHAVGIAAMSGVGMWEQGGTASSLWLSGSATRSGLLALAGAQAGVDAPPRALDGDFGAFRAYCGKDRGVLEDRLARLGEEWATPSVMFQPFSGDTYSQAPLDCVRQLRQRFGLDRPAESAEAGESAKSGAAAPEAPPSAELDHIVVRCDGRTALGIERKHNRYPRVSTALQLNSDPQSRVAAGWLRGVYSYQVGFESLLEDAEVASLRERVHFEHDPSLADMSQAAVVLHFADGTSALASTAGFSGSIANPLSDEQLASWFRRAAEGLLAPQRAEAVLEAVWRLDEPGSSTAGLVRALSAPPDGLA